jgi:hypothetical protein
MKVEQLFCQRYAGGGESQPEEEHEYGYTGQYRSRLHEPPGRYRLRSTIGQRFEDRGDPRSNRLAVRGVQGDLTSRSGSQERLELLCGARPASDTRLLHDPGV